MCEPAFVLSSLTYPAPFLRNKAHGPYHFVFSLLFDGGPQNHGDRWLGHFIERKSCKKKMNTASSVLLKDSWDLGVGLGLGFLLPLVTVLVGVTAPLGLFLLLLVLSFLPKKHFQLTLTKLRFFKTLLKQSIFWLIFLVHRPIPMTTPTCSPTPPSHPPLGFLLCLPHSPAPQCFSFLSLISFPSPIA